jgi:hypothetical protein
MSNGTLAMALLAASALVLACDATEETRRSDGRATAADQGQAPFADVGVGVRPDVGQGLRPDAGGSAPRDAAAGSDAAIAPADQGAAGLSCAEILQCREQCPPDQACYDGCVAQGSATAQQQHAALATCVKNALTGSCSSSCSDVASAACSTCWQAACKAEIAACTPS